MLRLTYLGDTKSYMVSFSNVSNNIVQLIGKFPIKKVGFYLSREDKRDNWDYSEYKTVYKKVDGGVQFSNDGSVYVEPIPVVNFHTNGGGVLDGVTSQEVKNYEELIIPTPVANENYEFTGWSPEVPESGEIVGNKTFTAIFKSTIPVPDPEPVPSLEDDVAELKESVTELKSDMLALNQVLIGGTTNE